MTSYTYDARGRVLSSSRGAARSHFDLQFTYDRAERLTLVQGRNPAYVQGDPARPEFRPVKEFSFATDNDLSSAPADLREGKLLTAPRYNYPPPGESAAYHLSGIYKVSERYGYKDAAGRRTHRTTAIFAADSLVTSWQPVREISMNVEYDDLSLPVRVSYPMCQSCGVPPEWQRRLATSYDRGQVSTMAGFVGQPITYWPNGMRRELIHDNSVADTQLIDQGTMMPRPLAMKSALYDSCTPPVITQQPAGGRITAETPSISLSVVASGTAPLTYQWYADLSPIAGAAGSTYTAAPATTTRYHVQVQNRCRSNNSNEVTVSVGGDCASPWAAAKEAVSAGDKMWKLDTDIGGAGPLTVAWYRSSDHVKVGDGQSVTVGPVTRTASYYVLRQSDARLQHGRGEVVRHDRGGVADHGGRSSCRPRLGNEPHRGGLAGIGRRGPVQGRAQRCGLGREGRSVIAVIYGHGCSRRSCVRIPGTGHRRRGPERLGLQQLRCRGASVLYAHRTPSDDLDPGVQRNARCGERRARCGRMADRDVEQHHCAERAAAGAARGDPRLARDLVPSAHERGAAGARRPRGRLHGHRSARSPRPGLTRAGSAGENAMSALRRGALLASVFALAVSAQQPPPTAGARGEFILVLEEGASLHPSTGKAAVPDVGRYGGVVLGSRGKYRFIELPLAAARALCAEASVAFLQRVWKGEPFENRGESPCSPSKHSSAVRTDGEEDLTWDTGTYLYDGRGNIRAIGADTYAYDTAGRLITATVKGKTENLPVRLVRKSVGAERGRRAAEGDRGGLFEQSSVRHLVRRGRERGHARAERAFVRLGGHAGLRR